MNKREELLEKLEDVMWRSLDECLCFYDADLPLDAKACMETFRLTVLAYDVIKGQLENQNLSEDLT